MKNRKAWCFGTEYTVEYVDKIDGPYEGLYYYTEKKILVEKQESNDDEKQTTIHELVHALQYECSWTQVLGNDMIEIIADQVGKMMVKNFDIKWKKSR